MGRLRLRWSRGWADYSGTLFLVEACGVARASPCSCVRPEDLFLSAGSCQRHASRCSSRSPGTGDKRQSRGRPTTTKAGKKKTEGKNPQKKHPLPKMEINTRVNFYSDQTIPYFSNNHMFFLASHRFIFFC